VTLRVHGSPAAGKLAPPSLTGHTVLKQKTPEHFSHFHSPPHAGYNVGMRNQAPDFGQCFRLLGIRWDGSRAVVLGRMTLDEAKRARDAISEAGIFASVRVEQESSVDIPTLE